MTCAASGPEIDGPEAFRRAFAVTDAQIERLQIYAELLRQWQGAVNLVAPDSVAALWPRHFADSAQLVPLIGEARVCLDFGSGAGFPGLVVAMLRPEQPGAMVHLVESNARKCAFLRDVARQTGTAVEIHNARIEAVAGRGKVTGVEVIMARGVASLAGLLALSEPFFRSGAAGLFLKGRRTDDELAEARAVWSFDLQVHASMTNPEGRILRIEAAQRVEDRAR